MASVALVHERLTEFGGSEQVVAALHRIWPDAPVYAPIIDHDDLPPGLRDADLRSSPLQRLYRGGTGYAHLLPVLPMAMRGLRFGDAAMVVVSHHAFANRVGVADGVKLVSYTHTPARWMWDRSKRQFEIGGRTGRAALGAFAATQRGADARAAQRIDLLMVNSHHVEERVRRWWKRDAVVVHPPVDTDFFTADATVQREDFFLLAGRLVPYKRPEVAVQAATRAGVRLVVAGDGRSAPAVRSVAGPGVEMLGAVGRDQLRDLFRRCRALVFPGEEDFGMVPIEAQACGAPVIGLGAGGLRDGVIDGRTGALYDPEVDEVGAMAAAMKRFDDGYDPEVIRQHAAGFSEAVFRSRIIATISERLGDVA